MNKSETTSAYLHSTIVEDDQTYLVYRVCPAAGDNYEIRDTEGHHLAYAIDMADVKDFIANPPPSIVAKITGTVYDDDDPTNGEQIIEHPYITVANCRLAAATTTLNHAIQLQESDKHASAKTRNNITKLMEDVRGNRRVVRIAAAGIDTARPGDLRYLDSEVRMLADATVELQNSLRLWTK